MRQFLTVDSTNGNRPFTRSCSKGLSTFARAPSADTLLKKCTCWVTENGPRVIAKNWWHWYLIVTIEIWQSVLIHWKGNPFICDKDGNFQCLYLMIGNWGPLAWTTSDRNQEYRERVYKESIGEGKNIVGQLSYKTLITILTKWAQICATCVSTKTNTTFR